MKIIFFVFLFFSIAQFAGAENKVDVSVEAESQMNQLFEAGEARRNYPNGLMPGFPGFPGYFADPLMSHEFLSLAEFAGAKLEWTYEEICNWSEDTDHIVTETRGRSVRSAHQASDRIKIVLKKPKEYEFIGFIQANAKKKDTPMEAVFSVLAMESLKLGGNVIVPINEGARRVLSASAWGISLGYTQVKIGGGSEQDAGVGAVGVGYASGKSFYRHEPFARVMVIKVSPLDYEKISINGQSKKLEEENEALRHQMEQMEKYILHMQQQGGSK